MQNIKTMTFDLIEVMGVNALYVEERISEVPKGLHLYHLRETNEENSFGALEKPPVVVNFGASIITWIPIEFKGEDYIEFTKENEDDAPNFIDNQVTLSMFLCSEIKRYALTMKFASNWSFSHSFNVILNASESFDIKEYLTNEEICGLFLDAYTTNIPRNFKTYGISGIASDDSKGWYRDMDNDDILNILVPHIKGQSGQAIDTTFFDKQYNAVHTGDILEYELNGEKKRCVVMFGKYFPNGMPALDDAGHIGFYVEHLGYGERFARVDLGYYLPRSEIIGNIYKNPELLILNG